MADLEPAKDKSADPFVPENVGGVQLIVLMRCYDALMSILNVLDTDLCTQLHQSHASGGIEGSLPFIQLEPKQVDQYDADNA